MVSGQVMDLIPTLFPLSDLGIGEIHPAFANCPLFF